MKAVKLSAITATLLLSTSAMANVAVVDSGRTVMQTVMKPAAISAEVGTLGIGGRVSWAVTDKTEVQAGWNGGNIDQTLNLNVDATQDNFMSKTIKNALGDDFRRLNGNVRVAAKMNNPYLGAQFRPFSNAITVGTGVILNQNQVGIALDANGGQLPIGDYTFQLASTDTLTMNAKARNTLAPYLTVGLKPNLDSRFGVFGEVGAAYVGRYDVNVNANVGNNSGQIAVTKDGITVNVNANQLQRQLDAALEKAPQVPVYPVVKVGATLRF